MAEAPLQDVPPERRKRTLLLLSAGGASLLLPLAGLAYLHWSDTRPVPGPEGAADVFEHHEGQGPLVPTQAMPNVMAQTPAGGSQKLVSSLDFVKADPDFAARAAVVPANAHPAASAAAPAASTATAASAAPAVKKTAANAKKQFLMPKLHTGRGFMSFGSTGGGGAANSGAAASGAAPTAQQQMLQNLPPGAVNDPAIQKYLQSQQGH